MCLGFVLTQSFNHTSSGKFILSCQWCLLMYWADSKCLLPVRQIPIVRNTVHTEIKLWTANATGLFTYICLLKRGS